MSNDNLDKKGIYEGIMVCQNGEMFDVTAMQEVLRLFLSLKESERKMVMNIVKDKGLVKNF